MLPWKRASILSSCESRRDLARAKIEGMIDPDLLREWFWVREHDGVTDFCVDGQAGPVHEYACYLSVHTDDGSPVVKDGVWHRSAWVGNVLVGQKNDGPLKGFDQHGKELWTAEVRGGYPLGWEDDLVYVTEGSFRY